MNRVFRSLPQFLVLLLVLSLALGCGPRAQAEVQPQSEVAALMPIRHATVDGRFFDLIELDQPGLEATKALVDATRYGEALDAWRDYVVLKLRSRRAALFGWHGYLQHPNRQAWAERLIGDESAAELVDILNLTGPPSADRHIDWLAKGDAGQLAYYGGYRGFTALVAAYHRTREPVYLAKWFEITDSFVVEQKRAELGLSKDERDGRLTMWDTKNAGENLSAAGRVHRLLGSLAYFAKALPDDAEPRNWNSEAKLPIATTLAPGATALIPADTLANIAISLYTDHAELLKAAYTKVGRAPNQRFSGLTGLALTAFYFDEFHAADSLMVEAGAALEDYIDSTVLPDGGDMEQSFNYNIGFVKEGRDVVELFPEDDRPAWVDLLADAVARRERLFASIARPFATLPRIGTYGGLAPPVGWEPLRADWLKRAHDDVSEISGDPVAAGIYAYLLGDAGAEPPPFTSVAMPYSGYYAMRDGWKITSHYLWFIAARKGSGHRKENINSLSVAAFGRTLLSNNGPQPYTPSFLTDEQRPDYEKFLSYSGEQSSRSSNTVLVDMQSQRRHLTPAPREAYKDPIVARWHSSKRFDLAEGRYDDGYGDGAWNSPAVCTVTHQRQILFLRQQGLWLVTDRLTGDGKPHDYQQQWHFPPPHEQWKVPSPGFTDEQIATDASLRQIRTTDPAGPNITLHQFSPAAISYARYYGSREPWLGWYAIGIGGERYPSVDVHTVWRAEGDSIVSTVLAPSRDLAPIVKASRDLSVATDIAGGSLSGCELSLHDGTMVRWLAAQSTATLELAGIKARAEALLVVLAPDGGTTGLALGVETLALNGIKQPTVPRDFEFALQDGAMQIVAKINFPKTPDAVELRPAPGLFIDRVEVGLVPSPRPGVSVHYTLDRTLPTDQSPAFTEVLQFDAPTTLTLLPFREGEPSGPTMVARYDVRALPPTPPVPTLALADLTPTAAAVETFKLTANASCYGGGPLSIAGAVYPKGYSVHATAHLDFAIPAGTRRFVATVGLDDVTAGRGDAVVRLLVGDTELAATPVLTGMNQRFWHLDCALPADAKTLRILVEPAPDSSGWNMVDIVNAGFISVTPE